MSYLNSGKPTLGKEPSVARPSWISRLFNTPRVAGPPIVSVDMIPKRRAFFDWSELNQDLPHMRATHEHVLLGSLNGRRLEAEVYVPDGPGPFGALLYLHGGAFCTLSPAHVRKLAMRLAGNTFVVVNLDYSLAPEHPFPRAVEDSVFAARWITCNAHRYGCDSRRFLIGGDSSGGNLAAAATAFLTGSKTNPINEGELSGVPVEVSGLVLLYGVYDFQRRLLEPSTTVGTTEIMSNLAYLGPHFLQHHKNPLVSPILASSLSAFPPTYLCCGAWDATLGQSLAMTHALADLDVPVTLSVVPGMDHEFLLAADREPLARLELQRILEWMNALPARQAGGQVAIPQDVTIIP
jgi:acetyl esterase